MSELPSPPNLPPLLIAEPDEPEAPAEQPPLEAVPPPDPDAAHRPPPWAKVPEWPGGRSRVPQGVTVYFLALPLRLARRKEHAEATLVMVDGKPELCRQVMCWELSVGDERAAFKRAGGDSNLASHELTKMFVRAVDGHVADHGNPASPHSVDRLWEDLGPRLRNLLSGFYGRVHHLGGSEVQLFFDYCVGLATPVS